MAKILAEEGWDLVIVGRSKDRLEKMRNDLSSENGVKVTVVEADLSLDGAAQGVYETVKGYGIEVDYLINCAGIGDFGFFAVLVLFEVGKNNIGTMLGKHQCSVAANAT